MPGNLLAQFCKRLFFQSSNPEHHTPYLSPSPLNHHPMSLPPHLPETSLINSRPAHSPVGVPPTFQPP